MREITIERRYFKNDDEWHYMLSQIGLAKHVSKSNDTIDESTEVESVTFNADIEIKWIDKD